MVEPFPSVVWITKFKSWCRTRLGLHGFGVLWHLMEFQYDSICAMVKTWAVFVQFFGGWSSVHEQELLEKHVVRIPIMGWVTIAHVPVLTQAHMDHHGST